MTGHRPCNWVLLSLWLLSALVCLPAMALDSADEFIAVGDQAWATRAEGHQGSRAAAEPVEKAIAAYQNALDLEPDNLDARWKLLRAFYFKGEFVLDSDKQRLALYQSGREVAETGRLQIEADYELGRGLFKTEPAEVVRAVGSRTAVAEYCFWAAANWGLWGHYSGKLISALTGLVNKIRQLAEIMVLMDESIENGGGHRLLGQFNARVPRIPIFTWWVDRDLAISELRRSLEVAPDSLLSRIYLAEALLKFREGGDGEALMLLRQTVESDPDPDRLVEDIRVIEDAKLLLERNLR